MSDQDEQEVVEQEVVESKVEMNPFALFAAAFLILALLATFVVNNHSGRDVVLWFCFVAFFGASIGWQIRAWTPPTADEEK